MILKPKLIIFAGANGSGKTTFALEYLSQESSETNIFLNADEIARGLSPLNPNSQRIAAGKILLQRTEHFIESRTSFALETTLSGRTYLKYFRAAREKGFQITLYFFHTHDPAINIERIRNRVKEGGHDVLDRDVRRRHQRSLENLVKIYWIVCDIIYIYDTKDGANNLVSVKFADEYKIIDDSEVTDKIIKYQND